MWLRVFLTPSVWVQLYRYDERWDRALNELLERYDFTGIGECTAELGPLKVWIVNHPYASMRPHQAGAYLPLDVRPSRATILRAGDQLEAARQPEPPSDPLADLLAKHGLSSPTVVAAYQPAGRAS
jgi:hypothetical protein